MPGSISITASGAEITPKFAAAMRVAGRWDFRPAPGRRLKRKRHLDDFGNENPGCKVAPRCF